MERSKRQYFSFCSQELRCSAQGRPSDLLSGCVRLVLLSIGFALLVAAAPSGEDPAAVLKRAFDAAKSALASGDLSNAERHYDEAIALCLRQLANLSVSESRFDEATRELDEALKFAPGDTEITTDAALAWFRAGNVKKARELVGSASLRIRGRLALKMFWDALISIGATTNPPFTSCKLRWPSTMTSRLPTFLALPT